MPTPLSPGPPRRHFVSAAGSGPGHGEEPGAAERLPAARRAALGGVLVRWEAAALLLLLLLLLESRGAAAEGVERHHGGEGGGGRGSSGAAAREVSAALLRAGGEPGLLWSCGGSTCPTPPAPGRAEITVPGEGKVKGSPAIGACLSPGSVARELPEGMLRAAAPPAPALRRR